MNRSGLNTKPAMFLAARRLRSSGLVSGLIAFAALLQIGVSGNLLNLAGLHYSVDGGTPVEKLHPAFYCCLLALMMVALQHALAGRQRRVVPPMPGGAILYLGGMALCACYAMAQNGPGAAIALCDSFVPPGIAALVLAGAAPLPLRRLRAWLQGMFFLAGMLCLVEAAGRFHIVPAVGDAADPVAEFRPYGLFDHPLTAAAMMALAAILSLNAPGLFRGRAGRIANAAFFTLCCAACGGRAALAVLALVLCGLSAQAMRGVALRRHTLWPALACGFLVLAACLAALMLMAQAGLLDRLASHAQWDASAATRLGEFSVLAQLTPAEFAFGINRDALIALLGPMRLTQGVGVLENFWLLMFCNLGLVVFPVFVAALASLIRLLLARADRVSAAAILGLLVICSASNSLGRKSPVLFLVVVAAAAFRAPPAGGDAADAARAGAAA